MRLRVAHTSVYRYDPPAAGVIQVLRLTPRNHDGQYIVGWRIVGGSEDPEQDLRRALQFCLAREAEVSGAAPLRTDRPA